MSKRPGATPTPTPTKSFKPAPRPASKPPPQKVAASSDSDDDDEDEEVLARLRRDSKHATAAPSWSSPSHSSPSSSSSFAPTAPGKKTSSSLAASLASGKAPAGSVVVTRRLGETPNSKTARYLRNAMDKFRPILEHTIQQDTDAFNKKINLPDWRDADGKHSSTALRNIDELLNSDADFIPYKNFSIMQHHENQLAMLGGVPVSGQAQANPFLRVSNKERVTFDHLYKNIEAVIEPVICETDSFAVRPAQRLVIGAWLQRYPVEMHARVRHMNDDCSSASQAGIPPNVRPSLTLLNLRTGNGKTLIGILMAMTELCNPKLWYNLNSSWRSIVWSKSAMNGIGLTNCSHLTNQVLARVTIAFIPSPLMRQWEATAKLVNEAMCTEFGYGFTIWVGLSVLQRGGAGIDGQDTIRKTLKEAHRRSSKDDKAILWIVPARTESATQTLRETPDVCFATRIYDECTSTTEPRCAARESQPLTNLILQATVERLKKATQNQSRHPLRLALDHQAYDSGSPKHASIFHMLSIPDWIGYMVSEDMADVMPCGIKRIQLNIRVQSLSGRLLKSDLTITGIDELLKIVLKSVGGDQSLSHEEHGALLEKCQLILGTAATKDGAAVGTIHERLKEAEIGVTVQMRALPTCPPVLPGEERWTLDQRQYWERIAAKVRAFNSMARMFERLAESMDPVNRVECPIGMEFFPPEHAAIFFCCTNLFDNRNRCYLKEMCPICGQPLKDGIFMANQAITALDKVATTPAPDTDPVVDAAPLIVGKEDKLVEAFKELSATDKAFSGSIKAVVETITTFLRYMPKGARILLAFACEGNEGHATRHTRSTLKGALGEKVGSIESIGGKSNKIVEAFVHMDESNRILLINTNDRSLSLEGLDLWTAQLIILDKMASAFLQPATVVQAIGRIIRPQFEEYIPDGTGITSSSSARGGKKRVGHPAKWLVLLEKLADAGPARVADAPHPEPEMEVVVEDDDDEEEAEQMAQVALNNANQDEWQHVDPAALVDVAPEEARAFLDN